MSVNLGDQECVKEVKISVHLNKAQRKNLIHLLTKYIDVFFWEVSEILGLSTNVVSHKLLTNSGFWSSETEGSEVQSSINFED